MSAIILMLLGLGGMALGFFVYSKFLALVVFKLSDKFRTPAHEFEDGVDFVPTNKFVLWGHHFTSVAGAAPIVGPAIAVIWGWLPALLWVALVRYFLPVCMTWVQSGPVCATRLNPWVHCLVMWLASAPAPCL